MSQSHRRGPPRNQSGCFWCGDEKDHRDDRSECPANGKECNNCGIFGHFGKQCFRKKNINCIKIRSIKTEKDHLSPERGKERMEMPKRHARTPPELNIGDEVQVRDKVSKEWDRSAIIIGKGKNRAYELKMRSGRYARSKRKYIRPIKKPEEFEEHSEEPIPEKRKCSSQTVRKRKPQKNETSSPTNQEDQLS